MLQRIVVGLALVFGFSLTAHAQYDNWVDQQIAEIATAMELESANAAAGCNRDLIQGCGCSAGSGGSCICSGTGNQKICSCSDNDGTMYCYHCGNSSSNCECSPTRPANPGSVPCSVVTMKVRAGIVALR